MKRTIAFDMDGTIADLYNQSNWLHCLQNELPIFDTLQPMYDNINDIIQALQTKYNVVVITWTPMDCSEEYHKQTTREKKVWLKKHCPTIKTVYALKYGTPKYTVYKNVKNVILVDDNEEVRKEWEEKGGLTINAQNNILPILKGLI